MEKSCILITSITSSHMNFDRFCKNVCDACTIIVLLNKRRKNMNSNVFVHMNHGNNDAIELLSFKNYHSKSNRNEKSVF